MRLAIKLMLTDDISAQLHALLMSLEEATTTRAFCAKLDEIQFDEYQLEDVSVLLF
jgi:hypothetical protein